MMYLILSMLSSAAIMVVFKLFERYRIETSDAIVVNYAVAASLSFALDPSGIGFGEATHEPWFVNALIMGVLFISLFNIIGISAQRIGVSVTTVANKMSLVIPVLYAIFSLGESCGIYKVCGLTAALAAVILTTRKNEHHVVEPRYLSFPFIVFIGSGFIDTTKYTPWVRMAWSPLRVGYSSLQAASVWGFGSTGISRIKKCRH